MRLVKGLRATAFTALSIVAIAASSAPASATTVMLKGSNSNAEIASFLTTNGHTVVADSNVYAGVDAVVLLRTTGDTDLANFVLGGGTLVTEWTGADWAMANLLGGTVNDGFFVGAGTTVTFTAAGLAAGLGAGVGANYSAGVGSEFFRDFGGLGTGSVLATRPGDIAAIVGGAAGSGYVVANGIDWADSFGDTGAANGQVLLNSIGVGGMSAAVPEPTTWALMLLGFCAVGAAMRGRNRAERVRVRYA